MHNNVRLVFKRHIDDFVNSEEVITSIIKERFSMKEFLSNLGALIDPFSFRDMTEAVTSLSSAIKQGKNICIWGDYDVDGTTSSYTAYELLCKLCTLMESSSNIGYYLPHRENEGYGINNNGLDKIKASGFDFVLTVDCGIAAAAQVEYGQSIGLEFVVTDHHEYPEVPPQCPIINPHDGVYPFHGLSGCGTVFKLLEALYIHNNQHVGLVYEYLDIVAISTIADLMDLVGENRIVVKYGLALLQYNIDNNIRPWICTLLKAAKFSGAIDSYTIGFVIGPRLNSVGRLDDSMRILEFMLCTDEDKLKETALEIEELNNERKDMQANLVEVGDAMVKETGVCFGTTLVVDGRVGVVGLTASNLLEKYYRPTTIFSTMVKPGILKASARSIEGFNYFEKVIEPNRDIILGGGGHALAAGLAIKSEDIEEFQRRVNCIVEEESIKNPDLLVRKIHIDCELNPESVDFAFVNKVDQMAPFGQGNPAPTFFMRNLSIKEVKGVPLKDPKHVQLILTSGQHMFKGVIFKRADLIESLMSHVTIDVAFTLSINKFMGKTELNLLISYFQASDKTSDVD